MSAAPQILSIGHSTLPLDAFVALLAEHAVELLVDVRRYPGSRRNPQFGGETLGAALRASGIEYVHEPDLGGRRTPTGSTRNAAWRNAAFRGYADHMQTALFARALEALIELGTERRTAIMCAEAHPSRCHRRLISDALLARGCSVLHILDRGRSEEHALTPTARLRANGRLSYPGAESGQAGLFAED